ncbi:MAG TPA: response regulator [Patescibacteria group bacterium]|nr:response regulator [Patescibacteria group bacterium]
MSDTLRILLIEDEQILREILVKKCISEGFLVEAAEDGEAGLAKAKEMNPSAIILDILLPKMNGLDVLRALKKDDTLKSIPVLVISNSGQPIEISEIMQLGAHDCLIKTTFTPEEVIEKIKRITSNAHQTPQTQPTPAPVPQPLTAQTISPSPAGSKARIVIAEDDKFLRELASRKLESAGYQLHACIDGAEALKTIIEEKPDLVLLDVIMPDIDGFEVLKRLRENPDPQVAHIKVIILSNLGQESDMQKGKELNAADYLIKANFTMDEITQKVEAALKDVRI